MPTFLTPRIFALEYIKQRFDSDNLHFTSKKDVVTFNLPREVGTFVVNERNVLNLVETILKIFDCPQAGAWKYDPHNIIYERSKDREREGHNHDSNPIVEEYTNK